jgi:hypothetical protein
MSTLTGTIIANTYKQLLQVGTGNVGLTSSLQTVQDGVASNSPLQLSTDTVNINGIFLLNGTNLDTTINTISASISVNSAAITSINAIIGDGGTFATSAQLAATSLALATSIDNSNTRITSVSNFAVALSATMATSIGNSNTNITTNINAITSINAIIGDGGNYATSAELAATSVALATSIGNSNTNIAAVSVLTSVNAAAITSVSNFAVALSATMATSIGNSNTNIAAVSVLTSVNLAAITSITAINTQDVTLTGTPDYITISNQVITRNQVDLAADVTGNLPISNLNSGTGASGTSFWRGDGSWAAPTGTGDVVGPASSTDNAIARFDSTTGKLLQNSTVTISDAGAIAAASLTLTTDLAVADGGTGAGTFTANGVLVGNGTGALASTAVGTATHVLTSNGVGVAPTFQAAAGGVAGPASSTDNAITRFDSTTGNLLQNSTATISDTGDVIIAGNLSVGATVNSGSGVIENSATIATSITITSGSNAISVGPMTINSGITVTLPSGSRWVVL